MDSKKHIPGRIVPLGIPFHRYPCVDAHVRWCAVAQDTKLLGFFVVTNEYILCSPIEYSLKETSFRLHSV